MGSVRVLMANDYMMANEGAQSFQIDGRYDLPKLAKTVTPLKQIATKYVKGKVMRQWGVSSILVDIWFEMFKLSGSDKASCDSS